MYELYISKLHDDCDNLWQRLKTRVHYTDKDWFMARPAGHNTLNAFMKNLSEHARLSSQEYTNHSIHHTCITTLDRNGFEARHIVAISGHKSEATIREYSIKCPENKRKEMYETLSDHLGCTKKKKIEPTSTLAKNPQNDFHDSMPEMSNENSSYRMNITTKDINQLKTENFDLLELTNTDDDELLSKYLDENDSILKEHFSNCDNSTKPTTSNITSVVESRNITNVQNVNPNIPILPRMFFPNSNVTINYNFGK